MLNLKRTQNTKEVKISILVHKREFSIMKIITFVAFCNLLCLPALDRVQFL